MPIPSRATRAAALLRKSVHAATIELNGEEREEIFISRKHRLKVFKLAFFVMTFFLQTSDAISDVITIKEEQPSVRSSLKEEEHQEVLFGVDDFRDYLPASYEDRRYVTWHCRYSTRWDQSRLTTDEEFVLGHSALREHFPDSEEDVHAER